MKKNQILGHVAVFFTWHKNSLHILNNLDALDSAAQKFSVYDNPT